MKGHLIIDLANLPEEGKSLRRRAAEGNFRPAAGGRAGRRAAGIRAVGAPVRLRVVADGNVVRAVRIHLREDAASFCANDPAGGRGGGDRDRTGRSNRRHGRAARGGADQLPGGPAMRGRRRAAEVRNRFPIFISGQVGGRWATHSAPRRERRPLVSSRHPQGPQGPTLTKLRPWPYQNAANPKAAKKCAAAPPAGVHRSSRAAPSAAAGCHRTSPAHPAVTTAIGKCSTSKLSEAPDVPSESITARGFPLAVIFRFLTFHHRILDPA